MARRPDMLDADNDCFNDDRCAAVFHAMFDDPRWEAANEQEGWKAVCREARDKIAALGYSQADATDYIQEELSCCE